MTNKTMSTMALKLYFKIDLKRVLSGFIWALFLVVKPNYRKTK